MDWLFTLPQKNLKKIMKLLKKPSNKIQRQLNMLWEMFMIRRILCCKACSWIAIYFKRQMKNLSKIESSF